MNPRGAKKFGEFWLVCETCGAVMAPSSKRALFPESSLLLTRAMMPVTKCPKCGSAALLRGELLERSGSKAEKFLAAG